jgi:hypothetical protein
MPHETTATVLATPFMQRHLPYAVGAVGRVVQRTPTAVLVEFDRDYENAYRVRGQLRGCADGTLKHVGGHVRIPLRRWRIVLDLADVELQTPCNGVSTGQKVATAPAVDAAAAQKPTSALPTPCNGVTTGQNAAAAQQTPCNGVTTGQNAAAAPQTPRSGVSTGMAAAAVSPRPPRLGGESVTPCNGVATGSARTPDYDALPPLYRNHDILPVLMVARVFHVTEQTINNWLRKPGCAAVRAIGCRRGVSIAALAAWLAGLGR